MSHMVSYKCFRRTQYIPRFGGDLQGSGVLLGRLVMIVYYGLTTRDQKGLTLWIGGSGNPPNT